MNIIQYIHVMYDNLMSVTINIARWIPYNTISVNSKADSCDKVNQSMLLHRQYDFLTYVLMDS